MSNLNISLGGANQPCSKENACLPQMLEHVQVCCEAKLLHVIFTECFNFSIFFWQR